LRANGSRERAPDDRLREAIQKPRRKTRCFIRLGRSEAGAELAATAAYAAVTHYLLSQMRCILRHDV
jgi:hypothetical protein